MAARTRRVIWVESAQHALDEVIAYISQESPDRAVRVLTRALDTAASLSMLAERGRVVREIGDSTLRELLVYDYRMLYRVREDRVVIRAFLHSARDFSTRASAGALSHRRCRPPTAPDPAERPVLLWVDREAGHGQGKPLNLRIRDVADQRIFLMWQLGMLDR